MRLLKKPIFWLACITFLLAVTVGLLVNSIRHNVPKSDRAGWRILIDLTPGFPARRIPDTIVLSPAADYPEAVGINWRTDTSIYDGVVQYRPVAAGGDEPAEFSVAPARLDRLTSVELMENNSVHCFSAVLAGLREGTTYQYRVGSAKTDSWSPYFTFTIPPTDKGFSFVYIGDTQDSAKSFGPLLSEIAGRNPDASFCLMSGDLVEKGEMRNQWDEFFHYSGTVFATVPLAIALGNHDYVNGSLNGLKNIDSYFNLPKNGVSGKFGDFTYAFSCGRVRFIVIDSRQYSAAGVEWLERELIRASGGDYDFTIVMMHYPMYSARDRRRGDNQPRRKAWRELFDKYGADLVLTGHDYSYMRTKRMRGDQEVEGDGPATIYVIATASDKFYEMNRQDEAVIQLEETKTYQVLNYHPASDGGDARLDYAAYDTRHQLVDSFSIVQQDKSGSD